MKPIVLSSLAALVVSLGACASSRADREASPPQSQSQTAPMDEGMKCECPMMGGDMKCPMMSEGKCPMMGGMDGEMAGGGMDGMGMCPMKVEGTNARAEQVEGGAAMAFTTTGDVAELRERVKKMANMHNGMMDSPSMKMPAATAQVEEIEGGARLVLQPKDPAELTALRQHLEKHAAKMNSGQCPMMNMQKSSSAAANGMHAH